MYRKGKRLLLDIRFISERWEASCRAQKRYRRQMLACGIADVIENPYADGIRNSLGGVRNWPGVFMRWMLIGGLKRRAVL